MKRFLTLLISVILFIFSSCMPLISAAAIDENINGTDCDTFAQNLGQLMQDEKAAIKKEYHIESDFSTARLIVKSSGIIDTMDAVDVVNGFDGLWILQYETPEKAKAAYEYYSTRSGVEFVEADNKIEISALPPQNKSQHLSWGTDYIHLGEFNQKIKESNIKTSETVVAVIDTGVEDDHPFFNGKVVPTKINTSDSGTRNSSKDDNGHGTQVAGVIADSTGSSVTIKPYKVLNNYGHGTTATVAAGIICAVYDKVDVINTSLGFYENSPALELAVKRAYDADIILVGAAGNDSTNEPYYPASYPEFIRVTAINSENTIANFSNYGPDVDFAAPGVEIYTTHLYGSYIKISGTSIAAPFVSALAATIKSLIPNGSAEDVRTVLENNALKPAGIYDADRLGGGVVCAPEIPENTANINGKTTTPTFSHETKIYTEPFELEIFSETPDAEIYYSTNGNFPSKYDANSIKYNGPITVDENIIITAVAYSEGKFRSKFASFMTIVAQRPDESLFTINENGLITGYSGNETSITIPDQINNITVTGIGANVFEFSNIVCVQLPKTAKTIEASAFEGCKSFRTLIAHNVTQIGDRAFYDCSGLTYIFLGELQSIGKYSFYNVCSATNQITGETFKLNAEKLTTIPEGAFSKAALSEISLGYIYSLGSKAFTDCAQLVSFNANYLISLTNSAFSGCTALKNVDIKGLGVVPKNAFSGCTSLESVNLPDVTYVNALAFENCKSLKKVMLPLAETVHSNAFSGCSSLILLALPSFKSFQINSTANGAYPILPQNLITFYAPEMKQTVPNMFVSCSKIKNILLNGATNLVEGTFNECTSLIYLDIESVTEINCDAFGNASANFIDARNLVNAEKLPDNSGILLSNSFNAVTNNAKNSTLYAPSGTYVESYAVENGYKFKSIPFIATQLPHCINDNSETVGFIPVGFNLTMQWYYNSEMSTENAMPIDGATSSSLTFTQDNPDGYYYCKITQDYEGIVSDTCTSFILKDTVPADYTEYNLAVTAANSVNKLIYKNYEDVEAALQVDVSGLYSHRQNEVDAQTQAILDALKNLERKKVNSFRIYASKTRLNVMQSTKLNVIVGPENATYAGITYSVDNPDVITISKTGYVRCIGHGTTTVKATLTNFDGSKLTAAVTFTCKETPQSVFLTIFFKLIMLLLSSRFH